MSKFAIDYTGLDNKINKRSFKLNDVKDRIEKIAFDVVKFKDDDVEQLWQIHSADDGEQYIVALYSEPKEVKNASNWNVLTSSGSSDLSVYYKDTFVTKLAINKLGLKDDASFITTYLPIKLSENKKLVSLLLNDLNSDFKKNLIKKYPELA